MPVSSFFRSLIRSLRFLKHQRSFRSVGPKGNTPTLQAYKHQQTDVTGVRSARSTRKKDTQLVVAQPKNILTLIPEKELCQQLFSLWSKRYGWLCFLFLHWSGFSSSKEGPQTGSGTRNTFLSSGKKISLAAGVSKKRVQQLTGGGHRRSR